ncbi:MAG: DcaP family trimeric outer membrane transporter, partial [Pirellulaceae bacterium]
VPPQQWSSTVDGEQQQLEAQQRQIDAQNELLKQLQDQVDTLSASTGDDSSSDSSEQSSMADSLAPPPEAGGALSQDFKHERVIPTSSNFTRPDAALNLKMPGIKTQIGIGGFSEFQMIFDGNGLNNNEFDTSFIPIPNQPSQTKFSVNPSRLGVSTLTPVASGRLNTVLTIDFNGELDEPIPRLRVAYGEYINDDRNWAILAGQTFTTMVDLKAQPETLDFAGPTGLFARRQPLLKFSRLYGRQILTELALETPEDGIYLEGDQFADPLSRWPAFVSAVNYLPNGNCIRNLRFAFLARDLRARALDATEDSAFGWSIVGSGRVMVPLFCHKNNIAFNVQYGDGYGGQLKSGPADGVFDPVTTDVATIPVFSTYGGYQFWWTDKMRSNLVYGYNSADNPDFIVGGALSSTLYSAANLVWNPTEKVTVGIEYLYGNRINQDDAKGTANRILLSTRFVY